MGKSKPQQVHPEAKRPRNSASLEASWRRISDITPNPSNTRLHGERSLEGLQASLRQFGQVWPILVDKTGTVIAHHGILEALKREGFEEAKVVYADGMTPEQQRAFVVADNRLAEISEWDEKGLRDELAALFELGFDMDSVGYEMKELHRLLEARARKGDPDDAPEPPTKAVTRPGDTWLLDKHRLYCGDATNAADVAAALRGDRPHLMVTDPPYGVEYDPDWRNRVGLNRRGPTSIGEVINDDRCDWREAWKLFPGDVAYVWHGGLLCSRVADSLEAAGFILRQQIIWNKHHFPVSRGDYHWQHEPCWYAVRKGSRGHWRGGRKQSTVWDVVTGIGWAQRHEGKDKHTNTLATQKPVECMKRPMENNSELEDAVYDPFVGSGSSIVAAEIASRRCIAIEIHPPYVDVAVQRWEEYTGKKATREKASAKAHHSRKPVREPA